MRSPRELPGLVRRHAAWAVRERWDRKVVRQVQGVWMVLPWSHRLPDYAGPGSAYGQNLVQLGAGLAAAEAPVTVLDVGANVGDSALQILHAADARVLCVEGDPEYLEYLHINGDRDPRITIVEALLSPEEDAPALTAVRRGGTTRFVSGDSADAAATVTAAELRRQHPEFANLRLVKSDTDGYDVALVPAIAEAWHDTRPLLFFEYDHHLSRVAGYDPLSVWPRLAELGYREVAAWDNGGRGLGRATVDEVARFTASLEEGAGRRARTYWDVAVAHADDTEGRRLIADLVPPLLADIR